MRGPDLLDVRLLWAPRSELAPIPGPGEIEKFSPVYSISGCDAPSYAISIDRTSRPAPMGALPRSGFVGKAGPRKNA